MRAPERSLLALGARLAELAAAAFLVLGPLASLGLADRFMKQQADLPQELLGRVSSTGSGMGAEAS